MTARRTLLESIGLYLDWMRQAKGYSETTITARRKVLEGFADWCSERGVTEPIEVTRAVVQRYQRHLFERVGRNNKRLSVATQYQRLTGIKSLFRYLARENLVLLNPAAELDMPRLEQKLPAQVLSVAEVKRILAQPRASDAIGIRDRAMLEVLYATAVRRSELVRLSIYAIDPERRVTHVRLGKGKKDRVVPISERAVKAVECYLTEARPKLVTSDTEVLFLSAEGQPLSPDHLTYIVKQHIEAAGIHRPGSCHTLRHAAATHMLEGGADVRFVQELLGHAKVTTTQVYTHVAITKLIEVYGKTHPSAQSERKPTTRPDEAVLKDELLEDLAAEEDEEAPGCPSEEEQG